MRRERPSRLQVQTARQILDVVRQEQFAAGHHLAEEALAARFGISRTPVRAALRLLAHNGFLRARRNQGYFLAGNYDKLEDGLDLPTSTDEALYMQIARDLVRKKLPPTFTETAMMRQYGASRSLVLTVLARMSEEGLVRRGKGREWTFQPFLDSKEEQQASYDLRLTLEPAGLRLPSFWLDRAALESCARHHRELLAARPIRASGSLLFDVDSGFHELLARMSGNSFFLSTIQQHNRLRRLVEYSGYKDGARLRAWCREHLSIIDALLSGDRAVAVKRLERHLRNARRQLSRSVSQDGE
jgi:DNA-binding GntR family transcriptional regulator